jgi:outer membrane protein OmpA-like peptidoglycan-associated protein
MSVSGKFGVSILILLLMSCSFGKSVKDAATAIQAKQYSVALDFLIDDYNDAVSKEQKSQIAYQIGDTYLILRELEDAKKWYKKSNELSANTSALLGLVKTSKGIEQYDEAILYLNELKSNNYSGQYIQDELRFCLEAKRLIADIDDEISLELSKLSSRSADFSPTFYEENFIIFTSSRDEAIGDDIYKWTGYDFTDFFIATKNSNRKARLFDATINTKDNEGTLCFNKDFTEMIFTRCPTVDVSKDTYCKLYVSNMVNSYWTTPRELSFIKEGFNYGHPALFENDSILIFSSDLDDGFGKRDLFYSERLENDQWTKPYPLPDKINTSGNEVFPTADGDTLYFSSDKIAGLGGLDIFKTYLNKENNSWSKPEHLRHPINSGADDFGLIIDRKQKDAKLAGYFSSARKGLGDDDIYYFEKNDLTLSKKAKPIIKLDTLLEEEKKTLFVLVKVFEYNLENENDPNSKTSSKSYLEDVLVKFIRNNSDTIKSFTESNGSIIQELSLDKSYKVVAQKRNYLSNRELFDTKNIDFGDEISKTINIELELDRIFVNKEIVLSNIYYDFNKWDIREDAKPTLDKLYVLLTENPFINIELSSHTDCRGEENYNLELSQKRAESVVSYLIEKGIDQNRIVPKGYGESTPTINCICSECSDEQHQKNRRTSFMIIE